MSDVTPQEENEPTTPVVEESKEESDAKDADKGLGLLVLLGVVVLVAALAIIFIPQFI